MIETDLTAVQLKPIDWLKPYPRNPKTHPPEQITNLVKLLKQQGWRKPLECNADGVLICGHARLKAALRMRLKKVPVIVHEFESEEQERLYRISDNKISEMGGWDHSLVKLEVLELHEVGIDVEPVGFEPWELQTMLNPKQDHLDLRPTDTNTIPKPKKRATTKKGDVWKLGKHKVMCGDSTEPADVKKLLGRMRADLIHADPPYGMGKEREGVANDNLRLEKLDDFQWAWWTAWRPFLNDTGSVYIWGNAPDLWRFYWSRLEQSEPLSLRNEIVWDKESAFGQSSEGNQCYPPATERLLFFMLGRQGFGNINKEDFFDGFEPLRAYLAAEFEKMGWNATDCKRVTGTHMFGHWVSQSQWQMPSRRHYVHLQAAAEGKAFKRTYADLRLEFENARHGGKHLGKQKTFQANRGYFDNTHANMTDVWRCGRVTGEERFGHATPKPVELMARVMNSSLPKDGLCLEPFGGTGSTLIGAQATRRRCFTMEMEPLYCDIIVERWQNVTGGKAKR